MPQRERERRRRGGYLGRATTPGRDNTPTILSQPSSKHFFVVFSALLFLLSWYGQLSIILSSASTNEPLDYLQQSPHYNSDWCTPLKSSYDSDTGFNLACPCTKNLPDGGPTQIREVHLFYHVGMVKNWREIVNDQFRTLDSCGLGKLAASLTITYTNGNSSDIEQLSKSYPFVRRLEGSRSVRYIPGPTKAPWELSAVNAIQDLCNSTELVDPPPENVAVLYFHNKGASRHTPDWKEKIDKVWSYSRSLYWRKYMEYYLLERPSLCLTALSHGATSCGVEFHLKPNLNYHYSGNFWMATCGLLKKIPRQRSNDYRAAELFLSKGKEGMGARFVGLIDTEWKLYQKLIRPNDYELREGFSLKSIEEHIALSVGNGTSSFFSNNHSVDVINNITESFLLRQG